MTDSNIIDMLLSNWAMLHKLFESFSTNVEGLSVVKLTTSTNRGIYKMCELYDVIPTYLTRVEAKILFSLVLHAQENAAVSASQVGAGSGLDFCHFLKYLVMIVYHSISKTKAYSSVYNTMESKVEVMLYKWGFADPTKFQVISSQ